VEIALTPALGPRVNTAATGDGFSSMTKVTACKRRGSPAGMVERNVSGTIAASSARYGISSAISPLPSSSGRSLKIECARSGQGSLAVLASSATA
jgi:hypothetical protein